MGFVVDEVAVGHVFSEYFCLMCKSEYIEELSVNTIAGNENRQIFSLKFEGTLYLKTRQITNPSFGIRRWKQLLRLRSGT
jgi:hypothetical protein